MIQLNCIKCGAGLSIDDAFAGGVCRCQHCGAIQKVPSPKRARPATPGAPPTAVVSAPPVPTAPPPTPVDSSDAPPPPEPATAEQPAVDADTAPAPDDHLTREDLKHLAEAVATSSGLHSTSTAPTPVAQPQAAPVVEYATPVPRTSNVGLVVGVIVAAVLVLAGFLSFLFLGRPIRVAPVPVAVPGQGTAGGAAAGVDAVYNKGLDPAVTMSTPNFLGVPLKGSTIIYLIDRGQGTIETFDGLRGAIMRSLKTLGPETRFQVIFWETRGELLFPTAGPERASEDNIKQAAKVVADAISSGASMIEKPLEKALAGKPDEICIATGKFGLDQSWAEDVKKVVAGKGVKVHTFAFGRSDSAAVLKTIADATGGTFREIDLATANKLADFAPTSGN